jgi:aminoglycoside phosphotransferase (APT) family kinase protein
LEIDVALVRELLLTQFPQWATLPIRAVAFDGWDNRTFHLGDEMSVRLPSGESYALQVDKEHHWLPKLAPLLPLQIPVPIAKGKPSDSYPWPWSIYRWLEGDSANQCRINDHRPMAIALAHFLWALQHADPSNGPLPGAHNFFRGAPLAVYDSQTRASLVALKGRIDIKSATTLWDRALSSNWTRAPVWLHGDVSASNLLMSQGQLSAVIDFGCSGIGDPACDLAIAWTFFPKEARDLFRSVLDIDDATWSRGRGWALWKALITLAKFSNEDVEMSTPVRSLIEVLCADD